MKPRSIAEISIGNHRWLPEYRHQDASHSRFKNWRQIWGRADFWRISGGITLDRCGLCQVAVPDLAFDADASLVGLSDRVWLILGGLISQYCRRCWRWGAICSARLGSARLGLAWLGLAWLGLADQAAVTFFAIPMAFRRAGSCVGDG